MGGGKGRQEVRKPLGQKYGVGSLGDAWDEIITKTARVPSRPDPQLQLQLFLGLQEKRSPPLLRPLCCWAEDAPLIQDRLGQIQYSTGAHGDTFLSDLAMAGDQYDLCVLLEEFRIDKGVPKSAQQGSAILDTGDVLLHDGSRPLIGQLGHFQAADLLRL